MTAQQSKRSCRQAVPPSSVVGHCGFDSLHCLTLRGPESQPTQGVPSTDISMLPVELQLIKVNCKDSLRQPCNRTDWRRCDLYPVGVVHYPWNFWGQHNKVCVPQEEIFNVLIAPLIQHKEQRQLCMQLRLKK